ncbi:hypothetical protein QBC39DRAFT_176056 [Podospora conica]|nr:hypothetical protein QBC39DRAFT_176056 [Schizothecium conicum]
MMPVPGENPQLDAETMVPTLIGVSATFAAVSTIIVALRLYTRFAIVGAPGGDDLTIAIAQVLSIGVSVVTVLQAQYGLGRHSWMVSPEDGLSQLKCLLAAMTIYNLAQIVTKMSFLLQYRRIFKEGGRTRPLCLHLILFLAAWGTTQEVLVGFACVPASVFLPSLRAICIDSLVVYYLTSVMNIVTDFVVFMVPLPALRALNLPRRQKLLVMSVFCLGFFTCVISIVRLFSLHAAVRGDDPPWDNVSSAYWSVIELNCGIICASLPPLRPLLRHLNIITTFSRTGDAEPRGASDYKGSYSKGSGARDAPGAGRPVYPLTNLSAMASREALQGREGESDGHESSCVYQAPEHAAQHGARRKSSRLTNNIWGGRGGVGGLSAGEEEVKVSRQAPVKESEGGITVTREFEYDKESLGRAR